MDISKEAEVTALFEKIEKQFGGLNYVLNGAGVLGGQYENRLDEVDESTWDFVMNINFRGQVLMTKSQVKLMLKSKPLPSKHSDRGTRRGVIVNMGSIASIRARSHAGAPCKFFYYNFSLLCNITARYCLETCSTRFNQKYCRHLWSRRNSLPFDSSSHGLYSHGSRSSRHPPRLGKVDTGRNSHEKVDLCRRSGGFNSISMVGTRRLHFR